MPKVAVLGAGAYGTALGGVLADNGYDIDYYDPKIEPERLKDVISGAEAILLVAPSGTAVRLLSHLPRDKFLIVASKGFLSEKHFSEFEDYAVLSGAGFADDIKSGKIVHLTATDGRVKGMFRSSNIKFDLTDDARGVLMCGALKNIYALLAGYKGLTAGSKRMKEFLEQASNEMGMILSENGAKMSTIRLSCGVKDLALTCGPGSRNYGFGAILGDDPSRKPDATVEGVSAMKRVLGGAIIVPEDAGLMHEIIEVMRENLTRFDRSI